MAKKNAPEDWATVSFNGRELSPPSEAFKKLILGETGRDYRIKEATLKDEVCNYSYEVTDGNGAGDIHSVKGTGIALDDLMHAFGKLNVHLAAIDDVFKHSGVEIEGIDNYHTHELSTLYFVTGFKVIGENENVVLKGSKYISSAGGRIDIATPKIPIDGLSSYPWWAELAEAIEHAQSEVELYKEGKHEAPEVKETKNPKQMSILDSAEDNADFDNAKL